MDHPGTALRKMLSDAGMSRKQLALRTGVTEKHICTVVNGQKSISPAFAQKLGYVFENTAFWLNLQSVYDSEQLRLEEEKAIGRVELALLEPLDEITAHFIERGYIPDDGSDTAKVIHLRELLRVSNLTSIRELLRNTFYLRSPFSNDRIDPYVFFAWQRLCEKEAENIPVADCLNTDILREKVPEMKAVMFEEPDRIVCMLQEMLAECGIAFQVVKSFRGMPVHAYIKETALGNLVLCMTIRHQRADSFWYTFFHEIGHILYRDFPKLFMDFDDQNGVSEIMANKFAYDTLISPYIYYPFLNSVRKITWRDIERLATDAGVQPFIALGRLQRDGTLDWSDFADKVVKYSWT